MPIEEVIRDLEFSLDAVRIRKAEIYDDVDALERLYGLIQEYRKYFSSAELFGDIIATIGIDVDMKQNEIELLCEKEDKLTTIIKVLKVCPDNIDSFTDIL